MQVLLRDSTGWFYAGKDCRTPHTSSAADFRDINIAAQLAADQGLAAPEVVLNYLSPRCQIALPVKEEWFPCDGASSFIEIQRREPSEVAALFLERDAPAMAEQRVILLVEDRDDDILLIRRAFAAARLTVPLQVVRNGQEAIEYLLGTGKYSDRDEYPLPDLILLDLKMPKMGGIEFLRWIKRQEKLKALRIIVLTSSQDISDVNAAYREGANSFLVKPLEFINYPAMMSTLAAFWLGDNQGPILERPSLPRPGASAEGA